MAKKRIKAKFGKDGGKDKHWKFALVDLDDGGDEIDVFPPRIVRNELVEIKTEDWDIPGQTVRLTNFRAFELMDNGDYAPAGDWGDLYITLAGEGTAQFILEVEEDDDFFDGDVPGAKAGKNRLIEFSAQIITDDGKIIEVDPILDERPGG